MRALAKLMVAASMTAAFSINAEAGLVGKTLDATYYHPDLSVPYDRAFFAPQSFTVADGIETIGIVEGVTALITDFSDSRLTITLNTVLDAPTWNTTSFNGILFKLQSPGILGIASAVTDSTTSLSGFDNSRVSFTDGTLGINWSGLSYTNGQQVVVDFTFQTSAATLASAVPETSSSLALLAGLGLFGLVARRRLMH